MCSGWCNNWVTRQHARCNNENTAVQFTGCAGRPNLHCESRCCQKVRTFKHSYWSVGEQILLFIFEWQMKNYVIKKYVSAVKYAKSTRLFVKWKCWTTPPQPNHTVTPTHIEPEQYNPWDKSTISRKLLKMDVLISETCWAVNSEIIQVTSSWCIFIQLICDYF